MSNCENGTRQEGHPCPNRARWLAGLAGAEDAKKICPVHLSPYLEGLWAEAVGADLIGVNVWLPNHVDLCVVRLP